MSEENYLESRGRRFRRGSLRMGLPLLGGVVGGALGKTTKGKILGAGLGGVSGELLARKITSNLDKKDLKRAGLNPHTSSMILGSRYAPEGSYIKFNTGNVYRYGDVTRDELRQMAEADSVGSHFNRHLKKRKYKKLGKL